MLCCALALTGSPAAQAASLAGAAPAATPKKPAAPTGVTAAESAGDLTVGWKAVSGATGYKVLIRNITTKQKSFTKATWYRDPASSKPLADIDFTDFTYGDKYAFEVVATNAAGGSPASAQADVTAVGFPDMIYSVAGNGVVFFGWQDAPGATSYQVVQYDNCDDNYSAPVKVTAKQKQITGFDGTKSAWVNVTKLTNGKCYDYVVRAYNSSDGHYPAASSLDTLLEPIGTPKWKTGTAAGDASAHLKWSTTTGATEYLVYMANQTKHKDNYALAKTVTPAKGTTQSVTVSKLVNGDTYSFFIIAANDYSGLTSTSPRNLTPRS